MGSSISQEEALTSEHNTATAEPATKTDEQQAQGTQPDATAEEKAQSEKVLDPALFNDEAVARRVVEGIIYLEGTVSFDKLKRRLNIEKSYLRTLIEKINEAYREADSALEILEVGDRFLMTPVAEVAGAISHMYERKKKKRISRSLLQTLSIIAHRQPITKAEIDEIRQTDSGRLIRRLMDEGFVEIKGRKDILNKPYTYGTTFNFLRHFNLSSLEDLPKLRELKELDFDKI